MVKNVTIALLFFTLSAFSMQDGAREYFKFAKFNFDNKDYNKALDYINKAIEIDPNYQNGYILRAEISYKLGDFDAVIRDITRVVDSKEHSTSLMARPYLLRGTAFFNLGDITKALSDVERCLALDPDNAGAYFLQGQILYKQNDTFEALESLDRAITLDADNQEYYYYRALVKIDHYKPIPGTKTYENIMTDIKLATALDPNDYRPYELKCKMLKLKVEKDKETYINELTNAINLFPDKAEFYAQRGMARVLDYDFSSAYDDFTKAIKLDPENEVNYRNRGLCLHNVNKYSRAIDDYTHAIDLMIRKFKQNQTKNQKKLLAETLVMRGRSYAAMRDNANACNDYYNAAKLGSKTGLNNYRKNCNVYE